MDTPERAAIRKSAHLSTVRFDLLEAAREILIETGEREYTVRVDGAVSFELTIKRTD